MRRYQAYYSIADAATLFAAISVAQIVFEPAALFPGFVSDIWHDVVGLLGIILAAIVVFARRMRDEYAQLCWFAAADTTIKGVLIGPFALLLLAAALRSERNAPLLSAVDGSTMLVWIWGGLITLFIFAFQFHRWKGSR